MRLRSRFVLAALALTALAAPAQDRIREVLGGEKATIVFSPNGGYSPRNYLKRFRSVEGDQLRYASQNGILAELIRRAPKGSKVRLAAFRLDEKEVVDSCFAAAKRGVEVKLWLKGPPGLVYMVDGHKAIVKRADQYLAERKAAGKESEWGDFQVQMGTAEQMSAYGKINDMHEKFGVVAVSETHGPGLNNAFLGTSNIGASSDTSHNEHRVFFCENPGATMRLWGEFARLWKHLGKCETHVGGDPNGPTNETPEPLPPQIKLPDGSFAKEDPALQFRFTYEKEGSGFHRISQDFLSAIGEAKNLAPGETVYVAQFGFGIPSITQALIRAAQQNPQVQFKIMVHMAEGDTSSTEDVATAGLANLKISVKWDSNKLKLAEGERPGVPQPGDPAPWLLHHKALLVGSRVLVTGSYNFFGDADDQGENVVIARANVDPALAPLLADTKAEFEAMWASPVMIDAATLFGPKGLYEQVQTASEEDGFLAVKNALSPTARTAEEIKASAGVQADVAKVTGWLELLARHRFAVKTEDGKFRLADDPDKVAHAGKDQRRKDAEKLPVEAIVAGTVTSEPNGGLSLTSGAQKWLLEPHAITTKLQGMVGQQVKVLGVVTAVPNEASKLAPLELIAPVGPVTPPPPVRESYEGIVTQTPQGPKLKVGAETFSISGPAAQVLTVAGSELVRVYAKKQGTTLTVTSVEADVLKDEDCTYSFQKVGAIKKGQKVEVTKLSAQKTSGMVLLTAGIRGYAPVGSLLIGRKPPSTGFTGSLPDGQ